MKKYCTSDCKAERGTVLKLKLLVVYTNATFAKGSVLLMFNDIASERSISKINLKFSQKKKRIKHSPNSEPNTGPQRLKTFAEKRT